MPGTVVGWLGDTAYLTDKKGCDQEGEMDLSSPSHLLGILCLLPLTFPAPFLLSTSPTGTLMSTHQPVKQRVTGSADDILLWI